MPIAGAAVWEPTEILSLTGIATMNCLQMSARGPLVLGLLLVCATPQAETAANADARAAGSNEHVNDLTPAAVVESPAGANPRQAIGRRSHP